MQHKHRLGKTGDIDHAIGPGFIANTKLLNAKANRRHWFEISGLLTALYFIELIPGVLPGIRGKIPQSFQGITHKAKRLHNT